MHSFRFSWDDRKNALNQRKHGIGFETAVRVFLDPLHLAVQDRIEGGEQRWQTIGRVGDLAVIIVAHTIQEEDQSGEWSEVIRIISARKATSRERKRYEEG